ncbi:uncharacterized protein LOC121784429 [Salvia splendens]|uniref:uncharacterized protein LOC121784429 n=1 Tax=Salvia splendens TaxID=180675 RepID=UPI001C2652BA|nr:uncharacterized protein LOC121784429 [Salvia splendens]
MTNYRSKSSSNAQMQTQPHHAPPANFRSHSTSSHSTPRRKLKKEPKCWSFSDPEFQRKRRVASYKVYCVEGKLKGSVRKSVRWLKNRYTQIVYGCWW